MMRSVSCSAAGLAAKRTPGPGRAGRADNAGYWIGRSGGQRLTSRYGRFVRLDATKLKVGRYLFERHGGKVVFFRRLVTVLRTYAAFLAGLNIMRWPRFTAFNAVGGLAWSVDKPVEIDTISSVGNQDASPAECGVVVN
jgi:hypothetical protein